MISALDEHLAELRQQREADLSAAQEAAFALDNGNTLFIQTCDSGYDYTLYGPDHTALDGGQLDAPGLTLPDAGQEALNLLGQTAAVAEVLLGDKLAAFQEAAEKANELSAPEAEKAAATDLSAEPTVTILWSESDKLQDGELCRCLWQTAFLKNWTPPSTQTGKGMVTRVAGTTRPRSALILP